MASLIVSKANDPSKKHLVEIFEDEILTYQKEDGSKEMRKRGRLARQLAKQNEFQDYSCISFKELEEAVDENLPFN